MSTSDLIDAALTAKANFTSATTAANTAAAALQTAAQALTAANQALHDDLSTNGPAVVVDETTTPPTVTLYTAADPDSYSATEIRVAA
jgi:hypothetical protein